MGFFERKLKEWEDYKQRQELMAQEQRQIEEARKQAEIDRKKEYCTWYTTQMRNFLNKLQENNFTPTWGFEAETIGLESNGLSLEGKIYGTTYIIDIHNTCGVAFDTNSKRICYYKIGGDYYEKYRTLSTPIYSYKFIPFSKIICARIEVDSQTTVSTVSAGGAIIGSVGAISESTSKSSVSTTPREIDFYIQTNDSKYPLISFKFSHNLGVRSDTHLVDSMRGLFSGSDELLTMSERSIERKCNTSLDREYKRFRKYSKSENDIITTSDGINIAMNDILKSLKLYTMKIDAIIQQCNKDSIVQSNQKGNAADEIAKLAKMKADGIITEDEFKQLKRKIINTL